MKTKNLAKEIGWAIIAIVISSILTLIISVSIVSADWLFSKGVPANVLIFFAGTSLFVLPFVLGGGIYLLKTRRLLRSILVGILSVIFTMTIGIAILFGLSGGGLSR